MLKASHSKWKKVQTKSQLRTLLKNMFLLLSLDLKNSNSSIIIALYSKLNCIFQKASLCNFLHLCLHCHVQLLSLTLSLSLVTYYLFKQMYTMYCSFDTFMRLHLTIRNKIKTAPLFSMRAFACLCACFHAVEHRVLNKKKTN